MDIGLVRYWDIGYCIILLLTILREALCTAIVVRPRGIYQYFVCAFPL